MVCFSVKKEFENFCLEVNGFLDSVSIDSLQEVVTLLEPLFEVSDRRLVSRDNAAKMIV